MRRVLAISSLKELYLQEMCSDSGVTTARDKRKYHKEPPKSASSFKNDVKETTSVQDTTTNEEDRVPRGNIVVFVDLVPLGLPLSFETKKKCRVNNP